MLVVKKIRSLKEATESPRERYDFLFDLAVGDGALGRFDEAHSYVKEMAEYPNEQACNLVGYQQTEQGQADEAVSWAKGIKNSTAGPRRWLVLWKRCSMRIRPRRTRKRSI